MDFTGRGSAEFDVDRWRSMRTSAKSAEERHVEFMNLFFEIGIIVEELGYFC